MKTITLEDLKQSITQIKLEGIKQRAPAFELINLNGRPVFVRILTKKEIGGQCRCCDKKSLFAVFEIDKFEHYADWEWCGSKNCDAG